MAASQVAKVSKFRETLPPEESELVICPPNCKEDHDCRWPNRPKPKKMIKVCPKCHLAEHEPDQFCDAVRSIPLKMVGIHAPGVPEVTAKSLMKHARLFGSQDVKEVAVMYGISLPAQFDSIPSKSSVEKRKKHVKMKPKKDQAQDLLDLGYTWTAIEDALDLPKSVSDRLKGELVR